MRVSDAAHRANAISRIKGDYGTRDHPSDTLTVNDFLSRIEQRLKTMREGMQPTLHNTYRRNHSGVVIEHDEQGEPVGFVAELLGSISDLLNLAQGCGIDAERELEVYLMHINWPQERRDAKRGRWDTDPRDAAKASQDGTADDEQVQYGDPIYAPPEPD